MRRSEEEFQQNEEIKKKFEKLLGRKISEYDLRECWTTGGITGGNCWGEETNLTLQTWEFVQIFGDSLKFGGEDLVNYHVEIDGVTPSN